ncbi:MAG: DUF308 domain-containing protein [Clostridia bacterium]|nr:DUF308 domain-containing protein [Clostridia bacterium]
MRLNKTVSGILSILLGVALMVCKDDMTGILLSAFGITFLVLGVLSLLQRQTVAGFVKLVLGVVALCFGWVLVKVAFYVLGALLVVYSVLQLSEYARCPRHRRSSFLAGVMPSVIGILAGLCLFFNHQGVMEWAFLLSGAFLVVSGALLLLGKSGRR